MKFTDLKLKDQFSYKKNVNWLAITVIFIASMMMHVVLRHGLPLDITVAQQMQYISSHTDLWQFAWLTWNAAAIALAVFGILLYLETNKGLIAKLGLLILMCGMVPDFIAEYHLSFKLARLAALPDAWAFDQVQQDAIRLTGLYANGLYNIGGVLLTIALIRSQRISVPLASFALLAWGMGLLLSLLMALNEIGGSEIATAIAMTLSLMFMFLSNIFIISAK